MSRKKLVEYVKHPAMLDGISEDELREWIQEFPYSQNLRLLLAKKIKQKSDADVDDSFIDAAMYSTDRSKMYEALNSSGESRDTGFRMEEPKIVEDVEATAQKNVGDTLSVQDVEKEDMTELKSEEVMTDSSESSLIDEDNVPGQTDLDPDSPEVTSKTEIDTLEISTNFNGNGLPEEDRFTSGESQPDDHQEILSNTPDPEVTSTALSDFSHWLLTLPQIQNDPGMNEIEQMVGHEPVSASLAELLTTQGHYERAISMYQKLQLIYPEKSAYFAAQIQKLKAT